MYDAVPDELSSVGLGPVTVIKGLVLSTLNVEEGELEGASFPIESLAVPERMVIPTVPSPVHPDMATSLVFVSTVVTILVEQVAPL